jgi:hypothetical protein
MSTTSDTARSIQTEFDDDIEWSTETGSDDGAWESGHDEPATTILKSSSDAGDPYIYEALHDGEFRLVEIQPGAFSDPVQCEIFHARIVDSEYEALSYTWDENTDDHRSSFQSRLPIVVSSSHILGNRHVQVTKNCESALRRVRAASQGQVIWVDALCINQLDVNERGHQVGYMPQIFSHATKVWAYLGELEDLPPVAEDPLTSSRENALVWEARLLETIGLLHGEEPNGSLQTHRKAISTFLRRRWFSRAWCLQEIGLSHDTTFLCGSFHFPWTNLKSAKLDCPFNNPFDFGGQCPLILTLETGTRLPFSAFYGLLTSARATCAATEPKDMVYAVVGLMENMPAWPTTPDYSLSTPVFFRFVTEYLIQNYRTLDVLAFAECRGEQKDMMHSWMIDWTARPKGESFAWNRRRDQATAGIHHDLLPLYGTVEPTSSDDLSIQFLEPPYLLAYSQRLASLCLVGYHLGTVVAVSSCWDTSACHLELPWHRESVRRLIDNVVMHTIMEDERRSHLRSILWGLRDIVRSSPGSERLKYAINDVGDGLPEQAVLSWWIWNRAACLHQLKSSNRGKLAAIGHTILQWLTRNRSTTLAYGRKLFFTQEGHFGFGPKDLKAGDRLVRFRDASIGHFIREASPGLGHPHILIGECFAGVKEDELEDYLQGIPPVILGSTDKIEQLGIAAQDFDMV